MMNVLLVGGGGREHAIAWKLRQSPQVERLLVAPGNPGTAELATNLPILPTEEEALVRAARNHRVELTVIGPEAPLALGLADRFQQEGLAVIGPTQRAARIETSKSFAKSLMQEHGVPTAKAQVFSSYREAKALLETAPLPLVIKADGLAAGKGVTVCYSREEALQAAHNCMEARIFGAAGERILVEECLTGPEVSVFAFTDGTHISPLVAACDYKRALDGDLGPNTGGVGSYSPPPFWTTDLAHEVTERIMRPAIDALAAGGSPYRGILYASLMLTAEGPMVIEYNCRLGDPEAQVILPRLTGDLMEPFMGVVNGTLDRCSVGWSSEACVGVVAVSAGYPGDYRTGYPIHGLEGLEPDALVFQAETQADGDGPSLVTDGGRVLTVVARAATLEQARQKVYTNLRQISFQGIQYRGDIAAGVATPGESAT